jgi:glyceraldehyde-3-phosphate dehydrogenase type I
MSIKIAINGFGRIGRPTFRKIIEEHPNLEIRAVNDLTDTKTLAHLLKYDSLYGRYEKEVKFSEKSILVEGREFPVFAEKDPEKLPWRELDIDIVLECTGRFRHLEDAQKHIKAGAKRVIISAPAKSEGIPSFVLGVNADKFEARKDEIVDMGSCTTNCLSPVVKILNDNFKIVKGFMTTVHSYTNDQRILDLPHKDLRRARAAALNIIPTTTGAAETVGKVIPEIKGKLNGIAIRVPTPTVSIIDLVVEVAKTTSVEEVNKTFQQAAREENLKGVLRTEEKPLVSTDFVGDSYSAIVDLSQTMVKDNLIKILAWYDNEYGYSCRLADFADYLGQRI